MCYPALPHTHSRSLFSCCTSPGPAFGLGFQAPGYVSNTNPHSPTEWLSPPRLRGSEDEVMCDIPSLPSHHFQIALGLPDVWRSCLRNITFNAHSLILSSYVHRPILRAFGRDCHVPKYLFLHRKQVRCAHTSFDRENPSTQLYLAFSNTASVSGQNSI